MSAVGDYNWFRNRLLAEDLTWTGAPTFSSPDASKPLVRVVNENADANGAILEMIKASASPADDDVAGLFRWSSDDSGGTETVVAQLEGIVSDVTDGDEAGEITLSVLMNGTMRNMLDINGYNGSVDQGEIVWNEDGQDVDFRIEAVGEPNAFVMTGSTGDIAMAGDLNVDGGDIKTAASDLTLDPSTGKVIIDHASVSKIDGNGSTSLFISASTGKLHLHAAADKDIEIDTQGDGVLNLRYPSDANSGLDGTLSGIPSGVTGAGSDVWLHIKIDGTDSYIPVWQ